MNHVALRHGANNLHSRKKVFLHYLCCEASHTSPGCLRAGFSVAMEISSRAGGRRPSRLEPALESIRKRSQSSSHKRKPTAMQLVRRHERSKSIRPKRKHLDQAPSGGLERLRLRQAHAGRLRYTSAIPSLPVSDPRRHIPASSWSAASSRCQSTPG